MNRHLIIRLPGSERQPVQWQLWPVTDTQDSKNHGYLNSTKELSLLAELFPDARVIALAPSDLVSVHTIRVPGRLNSAMLQSLPFRLEEELADEVENLHFAVLAKEGEKVYVAVVANEKMAFWRQALVHSGLNCRQLIPEALALPRKDDKPDNTVSALQADGLWLLRCDRWLFQACDTQWLPIALECLAGEKNGPLSVYSFNPAPNNCPGSWTVQNAGSPLEVLAPQATTEKANLLLGKWGVESSGRKILKPWRRSLVLVGLIMTVFTIQSLLAVVQIERQVSEVQTQSHAIYNRLFPGERVVRLESQMQQKLQALNNVGDHEPGLLYLLDQLATVVSNHSSLKPINLSYNQSQQTLRVEAMADNFETFTALREQSGSKLSISLETLSQNGEQARGTLIVMPSVERIDS